MVSARSLAGPGCRLAGLQVFVCLAFSAVCFSRAVRCWLQILDCLSEAAWMGSGHLRLEIGERDAEIVGDVQRRDELTSILEALCGLVEGHAGWQERLQSR